MKCETCPEELTSNEMKRHIDRGDQRCFKCIDKSTPSINTDKSTGSLPSKYTQPKTEKPLDEIIQQNTPPKPEEENKDTYAFPAPADQSPTPNLAPTIYDKKTPPRFKLSAEETATGKWQIKITIEGPDYLVTRSNTDSDVGDIIREPLAAIAMSMINSMETRLKAAGKTLADDPKEPKPEKEVKVKKAVKKT